MSKQPLAASFAQTITHEGAAAFDFSSSDPLTWLVFTKGATLFADGFYRSQTSELFSYSHALLAAERRERGFGIRQPVGTLSPLWRVAPFF